MKGFGRAPLLAAATLAALALGACAPSETAPASAAGDALDGELTISAAASLTQAFDELAAAFEAEHPGVDVRPISYDGSSTLATQLIEGAMVDVFASADERNVERVIDAGLADSASRFASNTLVIAVPAGNPGGIESLNDLADPGVTLVRCDAGAPCGAASVTLLERAGVTATPVSVEQNVTAVLTKVAAGETDAGLVYATDLAGRTDVEAIVPPQAREVVNHYSIAVLDGAADAEIAHAFVQFVLGTTGQAVLERLGFRRP